RSMTSLMRSSGAAISIAPLNAVPVQRHGATFDVPASVSVLRDATASRVTATSAVASCATIAAIIAARQIARSMASSVGAVDHPAEGTPDLIGGADRAHHRRRRRDAEVGHLQRRFAGEHVARFAALCRGDVYLDVARHAGYRQPAAGLDHERVG